jgi:streptogramin lyase
MHWGVVLIFGAAAFPALAVNCGPTYGADGIGLGRNGQVYAVHYEDPRLLEYRPQSGRFHELPAGEVSATFANQAGRLVDGEYDYAQDKGLARLSIDDKRGIAWATRFESNELLRFDIGTGSHQIIHLSGRFVGGRGDLPLAHDGSIRVLVADSDKGYLENGRLITIGVDGVVLTEVALPHVAFLSPQIVLDREERLWLAASAVSQNGPQLWLHRLEAERWLGEPLKTGYRFVTGLATDGRGRIWFAAVGNHSAIGTIRDGILVTQFRLPRKAHPHALKAAADGSVWFADWERHRLGRISHRNQLREYALPAGEESPLALAVTPDGKAVWFSALFNYGLFRLDATSGRTVHIAAPAPLRKGASADVCDAKPMPIHTRPGKTARPLRHPPGYGRDNDADLFEQSCHTACHSWYRVEQAASRRSDWTATVDRMILRNGASFIGDDQRRRLMDYLHKHFSTK